METYSLRSWNGQSGEGDRARVLQCGAGVLGVPLLPAASPPPKVASLLPVCACLPSLRGCGFCSFCSFCSPEATGPVLALHVALGSCGFCGFCGFCSFCGHCHVGQCSCCFRVCTSTGLTHPAGNIFTDSLHYRPIPLPFMLLRVRVVSVVSVVSVVIVMWASVVAVFVCVQVPV